MIQPYAIPQHPDPFDLAPQYSRMYHGRYSSYALERMARLREAVADESYAMRMVAVPDERNVAIGANRTFEGQIWLPPESVIWGIYGVSQRTEGFRVQLYEASTGERFFQTPVYFGNPSTADAITNQGHILNEPRLVLEPGLINVQLSNLSSNTGGNQVQLVIKYAMPLGKPRNPAAAELGAEAELIRLLRSKGVFNASASAAGQGFSPDSPPWLVMPANGLPFRQSGSIATPANNGTATTVLSFVVPDGWDGTIVALSNQYPGPGFVEGSGDLTWHIAVNGAFQKGYDSITTTMGSAAQPQEIPGAIRIFSGQTIEYKVTHATTSALSHGASVPIVCTMHGWFYPKT